MKLTVYKNTYGYSTLCKNKDQNGNEQKCYLNIQFKRGLEPSGEKTVMNIEDGFFSCYKDKNGNVLPKLVVMAWYPDDSHSNYVEAPKEDYGTPLADLQEQNKGIVEMVSVDDLPF